MHGTSTRIVVVAGALFLFGCGDSAGDGTERVESFPAALPVGTGGGTPPPLPAPKKDAGAPIDASVVWTPGPVIVVPRTCPSLYVEAHRPARTCSDILPTSSRAGGEWKVTSLYPDVENPDVRDHFCGYTWVPSWSLGCTVPMEALQLSGYSAGSFADFPANTDGSERARNRDSWTIRPDCAGTTKCTVGSATATERSGFKDTGHDARKGGGTASLLFRPGGGCETCGVVVGDHAYVINPGLTPGITKLTFNVTDVNNDRHQVDVPTPTTRVFSVELPSIGAAYKDGPILETWRAEH